MRTLNIFQLKLIWLLLAAIFLLALRLLRPLDIDPQAWSPKPAPTLDGVWRNAGLLDGRIQPFISQYDGGICAFDITSDGTVYAALNDGRIVSWRDGGKASVIAQLPTKPDTVHFDTVTNSIYASQSYPISLWQISPSGDATKLTLGGAVKHLHALTTSITGDVYAAQLSKKWSANNMQRMTLEHPKDGEVLRWRYDNMFTKPPEVILTSLAGATSLTLSSMTDYLLVLESSEYRVWRVWLNGSRAGEREVILDNLPGYLTGITPAQIPADAALPAGRDYFWLSLPTTREKAPLPDKLSNKTGLRRLLLNVPTKWLPKLKTQPFLVLFDDTGKVHLSLQTSDDFDMPAFKTIKQYGNSLIMMPTPLDEQTHNGKQTAADLYELPITANLLNQALKKSTS